MMVIGLLIMDELIKACFGLQPGSGPQPQPGPQPVIFQVEVWAKLYQAMVELGLKIWV